MTTIRTEQVNDYDDVATVNRMAFGQDAEALLVAKLREADG